MRSDLRGYKTLCESWKEWQDFRKRVQHTEYQSQVNKLNIYLLQVAFQGSRSNLFALDRRSYTALAEDSRGNGIVNALRR